MLKRWFAGCTLAAALLALASSGCLPAPVPVPDPDGADVVDPARGGGPGGVDPAGGGGSGSGSGSGSGTGPGADGPPSDSRGGEPPDRGGSTPPRNMPPGDPPGGPPPAGGGVEPFSDSAVGIVTRGGGPRRDPEGVAPDADEVALLTWRDARGRERTLTLGGYLYQYDFSFSDGIQEIERSANDDAWGHEGFGYVVSHNSVNGNSPLGKANAPVRVETVVFAGGHHAIHRVELLYDRDREPGGNGIQVPVVIEWLVATGRDHPLWAVNWRTGAAINPNNVDFDVYRMDTRGPYGSLNFDGAATRGDGAAIGTIGWGDFGARFDTRDEPLTLLSPWSYDRPNRVPFTYATAAGTNAVMGIVCTRAGDKEMGNPDRVFGRERGASSSAVFAKRGDCADFGDVRVYTLPCVQGWPYQLMNFDWDPSTGKPAGEATGTKLLAWGTPYGFVGASRFDLFDYSGTADGTGDRGYATFIVLGPKERYDEQTQAWDRPGDVELTIRQVEALAEARISDVERGALVSAAPRGPLSSQSRPLVGGYNDIYATYHLAADAGGVAFTFTPGATALAHPVFVIENYGSAGLPVVRLDGRAVRLNRDFAAGAFVSLDTAGDRLWVTLNGTVSAAVRVEVAAAAGGNLERSAAR